MLRKDLGPSGKCADSRQKLLNGIGFYEIVVGSAVQAVNPVMDGIQGSGHDNRHRDLVLADGPQDGQAVDLRQHPVQKDQVIGIRHGMIEPLASGMAAIRRVVPGI